MLLIWRAWLHKTNISNFCSASPTDSVVDSPQLSPYNPKGPLCLSPSFQMSTLSLPGQAPSPLQSPILSEVGSNAKLEEEEEGRRKVHCLHATLPPPASQPLLRVNWYHWTKTVQTCCCNSGGGGKIRWWSILCILKRMSLCSRSAIPPTRPTSLPKRFWPQSERTWKTSRSSLWWVSPENEWIFNFQQNCDYSNLGLYKCALMDNNEFN